MDIDIDKTILDYIDIDIFQKCRYKDNLGNIVIDIDIDKNYLENIDIDIDKDILENIDIYKDILGKSIIFSCFFGEISTVGISAFFEITTKYRCFF